MTKSFGALPKTAQAVEKLFGARSLDKAIEVQSEYAKAIYVDYIAQVTKFGELYVNLAKEVFKFEDHVAKPVVRT